LNTEEIRQAVKEAGNFEAASERGGRWVFEFI